MNPKKVYIILISIIIVLIIIVGVMVKKNADYEVCRRLMTPAGNN